MDGAGGVRLSACVFGDFKGDHDASEGNSRVDVSVQCG
jgi:hypothetical protein